MRPAMVRGIAFLAIAFVAGAFVAGASPARAESAADQRFATWLALFAHGPIHGDLWLWTDVHARSIGELEPQAALVRPGLSWRATPELFLTGGYAWTPSWRRSAAGAWGELDFTDEHRTWEQLLFAPSDVATGLAAQIRGRLEQRFRTAGALDVGLRLRLLVRGQLALTRARELIVVLWNEVFVGLNDTAWGQRAGFDQNRLFFGLGWQAVPAQLRFELGYTNQWIVRDAAPDPVQHIAALNAFVGWQ